jgi:hypothetical protein
VLATLRLDHRLRYPVQDDEPHDPRMRLTEITIEAVERADIRSGRSLDPGAGSGA